MKNWVLALVVASGVFALPSQVAAMQASAVRGGDCLSKFVDCQYEAALESSFFRRTVKALDCELNLIGCLADLLLW